MNSSHESTSDTATLRASLSALPKELLPHSFLVLMSGLPGTGKSYFSRHLAQEVPLIILETDLFRRVLFPKPKHSKGESRRLFDAIHQLIDDLLLEGLPVLLDATNLIEKQRETLYAIADANAAQLIIVETNAPIETVRIRLRHRAEGHRDPTDHSDADMRVYGRMRTVQEPISRSHWRVDTSQDITQAINAIAMAIQDSR